MVERADEVSREIFALYIRRGRAQMQHGCRGDAELEVAAHRAGDVCGLGHVNDFERVQDAAVLSGVDTDNVGCTDSGHVPGVAEGEDAFIGHHRNIIFHSQCGHFFVQTYAKGLLREEDVVLLHSGERAPGFVHGPAAICVDADPYIRAGQFSDRADPFDVFVRIEPHLHFEATASPIEEPLAELFSLLHGKGTDHHTDRHLLPHLAAEQLIDGQAGGFALDIPQSHLDGRFGKGIQFDRPFHGLTMTLDVGGILTGEGRPYQLFQNHDGPRTGLAAPSR